MSDTKSKALEALSNELREALQRIPAGEAIRKLVLIMLAEVDEAAEKRGYTRGLRRAAEIADRLTEFKPQKDQMLQQMFAGRTIAAKAIADTIRAEIQAAEGSSG